MTNWLVAIVCAVLSLVAGALGFFMLLLGLNGYSEAKGGAILSAYVVVVLVVAVLAAGAGHWAVGSITARSELPAWVAATFSVAGVVVGAVVLLLLGSIALLLAMPGP